MFKKKPSLTKLAEHRLQKAAVKRLRVAKAQRAVFLAKVRSARPTEATAQKADRLVERVRAAKAADFLQRYRAAP